MTNYTIRDGSSAEVSHFGLYDEANEGNAILVAELEGRVVAFAQHSGAYIYFLESDAPGAGTALVNALKDEYGSLFARNVSSESAGYWLKQGFERGAATGERPGEFDYEWYQEED